MHDLIERLHKSLELYKALKDRAVIVKAYGGRLEWDAHYSQLEQEYQQSLEALEALAGRGLDRE